jgi:hypothetical protein
MNVGLRKEALEKYYYLLASYFNKIEDLLK